MSPSANLKGVWECYTLRSVRNRTCIHRAERLVYGSAQNASSAQSYCHTQSAESPSAPAHRIKSFGAVKDDVNAKDGHPATCAVGLESRFATEPRWRRRKTESLRQLVPPHFSSQLLIDSNLLGLAVR